MNEPLNGIQRRDWLCGAVGAGLLAGTWPQLSLAQPRADVLTVLYRPDGQRPVPRNDPAVQAALLTLEDAFGKRGFKVLQPAPQLLDTLDRSPGVVISFADDAGLSLVFSLARSTRPLGGVQKQVTEVLLRTRVFVGHTILVSEESKGMMASSSEAEVREFAGTRAAEQAAQRAAEAMAAAVAPRIQALTPEEINRRTGLRPGTAVTLGSAPAPGAVAANPATPPPGNTASAGTPTLPAPKRRFALVVGVADYAPLRQLGGNLSRISDLTGVAADRRNMLKALEALGFPADNITMLADAQATSAALRQALGKLVAATQPDDLVLIAMFAHGGPAHLAPSGFGMPILSDFRGVGQGDPLDFWQLQSLVANLPARQTVLVVDTCHSGGVTGLMSNLVVSSAGSQLAPAAAGTDAGRLAQASPDGRALAVLAAAKPDELSYEVPGGDGGGMFTTAVVKALVAGKGKVPIGELFSQQMAPEVHRVHQEGCQRSQQRQCAKQTPVAAFAGAGQAIVL